MQSTRMGTPRKHSTPGGNLPAEGEMPGDRYDVQTTIRTTKEMADRIDDLANGELSAVGRSAVIRAALELGLRALEADHTKAYEALKPKNVGMTMSMTPPPPPRPRRRGSEP